MLRVLAWIATGLLVGCATAPPVQEMSDARQAIAAAEQADAQGYAPDPLNEARRYLTQAEGQIRQQAYGPARLNALRAKNRAVQALEASQRAAKSAEDGKRSKGDGEADGNGRSDGNGGKDD